MSEFFTGEQLATIMGTDSAKVTVEQKLNEYFTGVDADVEIHMYANVPHLRISYRNFKPTKTVRHDIENILPRVEFDELTRDFSENLVKDLLYNLYVEGMEFYHIVDENRIEHCSFIEFVNEKLYNVSIPATVNA